MTSEIDVVLFDYGGVLAEEGFTAGLKAIAKVFGIDPDELFNSAVEIIYDCGYVKGIATAGDFWNEVRRKYPEVTDDDNSLTSEILSRFILRSGMMGMVRNLKHNGIRTAILSDQTEWLYMLDERDSFLHEFSPVLNSFRLGMTKRDPEMFVTASEKLEAPPSRILFVDDNAGHIKRAESAGFQTHLFFDEKTFRDDLAGRNLFDASEEN